MSTARDFRRRVFVWGARSGAEQLPPFPEPTHRAWALTSRIPRKFDNCRVDFLSPAAKAAAHPPVRRGTGFPTTWPLPKPMPVDAEAAEKRAPATSNGRKAPRCVTDCDRFICPHLHILQILLGDVLKDLPAVGNFTFAESHSYECDLLSPFQVPFEIALQTVFRKHISKLLRAVLRPPVRANQMCEHVWEALSRLGVRLGGPQQRRASDQLFSPWFHPLQLHARRDPPQGRAPRSQRASAADAYMHRSVQATAGPILRLHREHGDRALAVVSCNGVICTPSRKDPTDFCLGTDTRPAQPVSVQCWRLRPRCLTPGTGSFRTPGGCELRGRCAALGFYGP